MAERLNTRAEAASYSETSNEEDPNKRSNHKSIFRTLRRRPAPRGTPASAPFPWLLGVSSPHRAKSGRGWGGPNPRQATHLTTRYGVNKASRTPRNKQ